tara:strand:+ start:137 stop:646 length:510 start_codon:yes stop_codon:yes gene_type:complete
MTNEQENFQAEESQVEEISNTQTEANDQTENTEEQSDVVTLSKSEYTKLKRQAIAYKSQKENPPAPSREKTGSSDTNRDELYLVAKGYDDDAIAQLQIIARGTGTSLKEALENPLFKGYEAKQKEEERKARAKLGASNGSGYNSPEPVVTPFMNDDDHKKAWQKMMSGK